MKKITFKIENGFIPKGFESTNLKELISLHPKNEGCFMYPFFGEGIIEKYLKVTFKKS